MNEHIGRPILVLVPSQLQKLVPAIIKDGPDGTGYVTLMEDIEWPTTEDQGHVTDSVPVAHCFEWNPGLLQGMNALVNAASESMRLAHVLFASTAVAAFGESEAPSVVLH